MTTVTIDKNYFETLLRRAELHSGDQDLLDPSGKSELVLIRRSEYDELQKFKKEYALLRESLLSGGIAPKTLEILVNHGSSDEKATAVDHALDGNGSTNSLHATKANGDSVKPRSPFDSKSYSFTQTTDKTHQYSNGDEGAHSASEENQDFDEEEQQLAWPADLMTNRQAVYTKHEDRTLRLRNIHEHAEHKDILKAICGGQVLDLWIRAADRFANVSFLEGSAAAAFLAHARRHGLFIQGKYVDVSWNDRQFILPAHVANKIRGGATRNIVIRGAHRHVTEERIRDDLEHIHNLIVVDINFADKDIYISLNSVHNALYARSCMMSRVLYKISKIEFYPDECAQPLPIIQNPQKVLQENQKSKKLNPLANRFQMLAMEGSEDGSETGKCYESGSADGVGL